MNNTKILSILSLLSIVSLYGMELQIMDLASEEGQFLTACFNGDPDKMEEVLNNNKNQVSRLLASTDLQSRTGLMIIAAYTNGNYMEAAKTYLKYCTNNEHQEAHFEDKGSYVENLNAATYAEKNDHPDLVQLFAQYGLEPFRNWKAIPASKGTAMVEDRVLNKIRSKKKLTSVDLTEIFSAFILKQSNGKYWLGTGEVEFFADLQEKKELTIPDDCLNVISSKQNLTRIDLMKIFSEYKVLQSTH